jgi:hypothetical protein
MESELGGLPAKADLRPPQGLLFRLLEYALVVGLLCGEDVKYDSGEFVCGGCDGLRLGSERGDSWARICLVARSGLGERMGRPRRFVHGLRFG